MCFLEFFFEKQGLFLKIGLGLWTGTPNDGDPEKSVPWKTWTLKNLKPEESEH